MSISIRYYFYMTFLLFVFACQSSDKHYLGNEIVIDSLQLDKGLRFFNVQDDSVIHYLEPYFQLYIGGKPLKEKEMDALAKLGFSYYKKNEILRADSILSYCMSQSDNCFYRYLLGTVKYAMSDFERAKELVLTARNCDLLDRNRIDTIEVELNLASIYAGLIENEKSPYKALALEYFRKVVTHLSKRDNINLQIKAYSDYATFYNAHYTTQTKNDTAIHYFQMVQQLCKNQEQCYPKSFHNNYGLCCEDLAYSSKDFTYLDSAKKYYFKEISILQKNKDSLARGVCFNNIGYFYKDKPDSGLTNNDTALFYLHQATLFIKDKKARVRSFEDYIRNRSITAKTYQKRYNKTQNIVDLDSALSYFAQIPELMDTMRTTLGEEESKTLLTRLLYNVYEPAIESAFTLYQTKQQEHYLQEAYNFIEAGKSLGLVESINDKKALVKGGIPLKLLEEEERLQKEINALKTRTDISNIQTKLSLEQDLAALLARFKQEYPRYYEWKYPNRFEDIQRIQEKCKAENRIFIDFFQGEGNVFALYITANDQGIIQKKIADTIVEQSVDSLYKLVNLMQKDNKEAETLYKKQSNYIYKLFFAELDSVLSKTKVMNDPLKVTLELDGYLHKIPFDALVKDTANKKYLIEDYNITYAYSAYLWLHPENKPQQNNQMIGFAPVFDDTLYKMFQHSTDLAEKELPSTLSTLPQLSEDYGMKIFLREKASLNTYEQEAEKYSIIHLATHAFANDAFPDSSCLALSPNKLDDSIQKGHLYLPNIYATPLNAQLVLLTACETAKGKIHKGEGVMSIARGFRYAGCERIIMTLWSVDDKETMGISQLFYENLAKGENYSDALYHAKRKRIGQNPYYWGAIVFIGNENGVFDMKKQKNYTWLIGGVCLFSIIIIFFRKRLFTLLRFFK